MAYNGREKIARATASKVICWKRKKVKYLSVGTSISMSQLFDLMDSIVRNHTSVPSRIKSGIL